MSRKRILYAMSALAILMVIATLGHFVPMHVSGLIGIASAAAIGPTTLTDPGIVKQWRALSQRAYWAAIYKSAFSDPAYTGVNKSRRKIEPRSDIYGPPFVEYYDLEKMKGDTITDTVMIPPFEGDMEVLFGTGNDLGYVRVKGQDRVGFEIQAGRKNIKFALQSYFFSAFEEDVRQSQQELGGDLLNLLVQNITDLGGRYKDANKIVTFHQGWSPNLYISIGQADAGIVDGDNVSGISSLGVSAPAEHPNTFAFVNTNTLADPVYKLLSANAVAAAAVTSLTADNWTGKVHEIVGQVDTKALPGRKMLDLIVQQIKALKIVPIRYRVPNGTGKAYYMMLVSPAMMNMLLDDPDLEKRFNYAFEGSMYKHPLIMETDRLYRNLIIREVEKFDQTMHTYDYNYGGDYVYGTTALGGLDARTGDGTDCTAVHFRKNTAINGTGRKQRVYLEYTPRHFRSTTNGSLAGESQPAGDDTAIGPNGGGKIDRIVILGASAMGIVPGPVYELDRRKEDEYGNILGIGQEFFGGNRRIEWSTVKSHNSGYDNQSSLVVAAYNGK